jgi:dihydroneopterin aldolase
VPNQSPFLPDEIHIEQLDVFTRVGVPEEERANPQRLTVSISFWPNQQTSDLADHIERTVNYSAVAEETKNFVKSFPIQKVTIELRKFALQDAKYVSVTVTRTASVG